MIGTKFKNSILAVAVIFFLTALFGCSSTDDREGKVVMWLVGSEGQAVTINELGEEFYKETGVKVHCEAISWGNAHSKYLTSIAGEVAPDIGTMGLTWGAEFGSLGAMVDLMEMAGADVDVMKLKIFPGMWEAVEYDGKVYGIPFDFTEHILYYRKDLIEHLPENWEELVRLLDELKDEDKGMIIEWGSMNWLGFSPFLWQAGGDFYNEDRTASALTTEEAVDALKFFTDLYKKHNVPKTTIPLEQGLRTGDFPIGISGNWKIETLKVGAPEIAGKWTIALLPKGPSGKRTAFIGGRIMGIFEQSKKKEAAWQFIKFLFRPESQLKLYEAAQTLQDTYLPPNIDTWDILPMDTHFRDVLKTQAMDAKGPPPVLGWDASTRFIDRAIQKVILEDDDPAVQLEKVAEEMDKRIGQMEMY